MSDDEKVPLAFGSWPSPITAVSLVAGAAAVGEIRADGNDVWWSEQRPDEGGRTQLVRRSASGATSDLFAPWDDGSGAADGLTSTWNARTAVMEYGGGAWVVRDRTVVFANWSDQRLHRVDVEGEPVPISPEPTNPRGWRWSEPTWLDDHWLVCVRESHEPDVVAEHGEAVNELVALPVDGAATDDPSRVRVLVSGPDFVHSPAVHGDRLAWIQWDHPRMPWDGTELCLATIGRDDDGAPVGISTPTLVAGGAEESMLQPGFTAAGDLVWCSDVDGWWKPWRACAANVPAADASPSPTSADATPPAAVSASIAAAPMLADADGAPTVASAPVLADPTVEVEVGGPVWVGGLRWWAELSGGRLVVSLTYDGAERLGLVHPDGELEELATPFTAVGQVIASGDGDHALVVAGTAVSEPAPYLVGLSERAEDDVADDGLQRAGGANEEDDAPTVFLERLRTPHSGDVGTEWFSSPEHITFPSAGGRVAHALHYAPHNPGAMGPEGARPPLIVMIHGGPTSSARHVLSLAKQFWTSRGFAVVDVDYGGSTGYGRPYRRLLDGQWGVVDVEDAVAAATYLADQGLADIDALAIRGGSAGGFTTLAALCFHHAFKAGASHYGVADLAALATETHKFESRYLDGLVGPWPEARATYEARSPIHHTEGFSAPLIVFQGDEDEVVPPNQAEMIVSALADKGIPHAYLLFPGEQHGFRQSKNIVRAQEAELWFYGKVFGFTPADPIDPVEGAVGL